LKARRSNKTFDIADDEEETPATGVEEDLDEAPEDDSEL
jgi:hypothetical protein